MIKQDLYGRIQKLRDIRNVSARTIQDRIYKIERLLEESITEIEKEEHKKTVYNALCEILFLKGYLDENS